ncbi:hypothetical protein SAMN03003324_00139 [Pedobacter antarcticus]|uniref:Uncharacterized protein n=1 Tax=Pedobacter antarcticus TaxID=34086 RepID=A0A1I1ZQE0_9SPHI|nr:hypothetical protein SAMN03003324_00139 [Pedobacter antarcticus]
MAFGSASGRPRVKFRECSGSSRTTALYGTHKTETEPELNFFPIHYTVFSAQLFQEWTKNWLGSGPEG